MGTFANTGKKLKRGEPMTTVYATIFPDPVKKFTMVLHNTTKCKKYQKAQERFTHSMDISLAKSLRVPKCPLCVPTAKKPKN